MGIAAIIDLTGVRTLFAPLARQRLETCGFAYLSDAGGLLGMRYTPSSSFVRVEIPIRAVATDALALDATQIMMAHNHPSGDATPSAEDLTVTRRLARAFDALGIRLVEHLILTPERATSLRELGVL